MENQSNSFSKISMLRLKVRFNSLKKRFLALLNQKKAEFRKEIILKQKTNAPSILPIDFMPLCCEEDLEILAAAQAEYQRKNPKSIS